MEMLTFENEVKENYEGSFIFERKANLTEVSKEIFENKNFSKGDIVLVDNDETLTPTLRNFFFNESFLDMPSDSRIFLDMCKEREISNAIVTNMPREGHYMNHENIVFGYQHYFEQGIFRKAEFPLTLCLGSLYKQTEKSLYEIGAWSMCNRQEDGRIAWVGNSYLDEGFGRRLEKILREMGFKEDFYLYRLPWIRSFRV